jgi:Tfp pilus assembly protein PilF
MKKAGRKSKGKKPQGTEEKKNKSIWFILPVLVAVPLVLYWQTTDFELVWDDVYIHLIRNPHLLPASSDNLLHFWKEPYVGLYIPVAYNGWALLDTWFSSKPHDPFLYHLANILLHTLNGLLVFALLRLFFRNPWAAMAGALIFLVHPLQVESVAWVSEFRGLLAALFGFTALFLHMKSLDAKYGNRGTKWPSPCGAICFLLALLSKPSVAVLPFIAASLEYYLHRPSLKQLCSRSWLWLWVAFSVAIAVVTSSAQGSLQSYPFWAKPLIWMDAVSFYLYKLLFPFSLAATYARTPEYVMGQWWFYVIWMIPVGLGLCLWHFRKKAPLVVLAAVIFILGFLPVSGLKEFNFQAWSTVADRYLYLSMLGVALGVGYAATRMGRKWHWGFVAAVILLHGAWSFSVQIPVWENRVKLWSHTIKISPGAARAYKNRGAAYLALKEHDRAIPDFDKAIALKPDFAEAYYARGLTYLEKEEYDEAISDFNRSVDLKPDYFAAYNNRGIAHVHKQEPDRAIADFDKALSLDPDYAEAYNNRGVIYGRKQETDKAISDFSRAVALNPKYADAYKNRGIMYHRKNEYDKALSDWRIIKELGGTVDEQFLQELIRKATE